MLWLSPAEALLYQEDSAVVVASFKKIVKSLEEFFASSPVILHTEDLPKLSPSGKINYLLKFEKLETSFDVTKTSSLISPYTAYVVLKLKASSNANVGDIKIDQVGAVGFQRAEGALKNRQFGSCSSMSAFADDGRERCIGDIKLTFAFQDGAWVFRSADLSDDSRIRDGQTAKVLRLNFLNNPEWKPVLSGKK